MSVVIDGSGTITGISVGGIPDGVVDTDVLAANAVTFGKIGTTEQGQLCKAWVNFNGTGTVAIRAAYNVSSITDNGTGNYTDNFTSAMADANYATVATGTADGSSIKSIFVQNSGQTITSVNVLTVGSAFYDTAITNVAIFR